MSFGIAYDEAIMTFRKRIKPSVKECGVGDCTPVRGDEWNYGNVLKALEPTDPCTLFQPDADFSAFIPAKTWTFRRIIWVFNEQHYWERVE